MFVVRGSWFVVRGSCPTPLWRPCPCRYDLVGASFNHPDLDTQDERGESLLDGKCLPEVILVMKKKAAKVKAKKKAPWQTAGPRAARRGRRGT